MVPYKGDSVATANTNPAGNNAQTEGTLSVTDNRTGEQYEIAISEGAEASCPFPKPTPVDAYCAALIDHHSYTPNP